MTQACIKENFPTSPNDVTEGEEVTLSMSVTVPGMEVATRALGEYDQYGNSLPTLWVVAFDEQGYLVEYAKASGQKSLGGEDKKWKTEFQVVLHATSEPRILHFIANYADNLSLTPGHESSVIGGMTVNKGEDNEDVYWQRIMLPGGINNNETYIKDNFTEIPLVRNFARIRVTDNASNFTLTGFYVLNVPTSGTVAPYSNGAFAVYPPNSYTALVNEGNGYIGNMPSGFENNDEDFYTNTTENSKNGNITFVAPESSFYMYENRYVGEARPITSVLIKGKFGETAAETYYRADIITAVNASKGIADYCHILRNFDYNLVINSVDAAGRATVKEAIEASASNNLVAAVEIADLTNVTIGGAALYVSYVSKTLVSDSEIELKYKYIPDINNKPNDTANDQIELDKISGGEVIASHKVEATDVDGWRTITIKPKSPGVRTAEQTITLYNQTTKIARKVTYTLRKKDIMAVECVPGSVASVAGTPVVVNIKIPQDLNPNIFPLEFAIEANTTAANNSSLKQYISPAKSENTSVRTGETIVTEKDEDGTTLKYAGAKSYQYIKKLSFEEYGKLSVSGTQVVLPVYFVTNTAASASTVYVSNMYFNDANASFDNFNATYNFAELEFGGRVLPGVGNNVTFTFNMDTDAPTNQVTVTLVGLEPGEDSGMTRVGTTNQYTITPLETAVSLNLVTTQEYGNVSVMLAADSYAGAVATAQQDLYSFSDLAFSGNVPAKTGENVTFTFNMDTAAPTNQVTVTLVGLEPGEDSGMTRVGTTNQYTINPSATATNPAVTLNLVTTQDSETVSVSLAAGQYNNASLSAVQKNEIVIPAGNISFSNLNLDAWNNTRTIYVYSDSNYSNQITSFTLSSDPGTNPELNLGEVSDDKTIYFRYQVQGWGWSTTYTASATVAELETGCTLEFEEQ